MTLGVVLMYILYVFKGHISGLFFVYFRLFPTLHNSINWRKHSRWCTWDLNLGRRQIHWTMAAPLTYYLLVRNNIGALKRCWRYLIHDANFMVTSRPDVEHLFKHSWICTRYCPIFIIHKEIKIHWSWLRDDKDKYK